MAGVVRSIASKTRIKLTITSDIVCPWCYVGKRHLDEAMENVKDAFEFSVAWKPFLLNPNVPEEGIPVEDNLAMKYGAAAKQKYLDGTLGFFDAGRKAGISFTKVRLSLPTKKSHLLMQFALNEGKQHEFQEKLFYAYFTGGLNINSPDVLKKLLSDTGLDSDKGMEVLDDADYIQSYSREIEEARAKGITGVPYFEISLQDDPKVPSLALSGAQPVQSFVHVFTRLQAQAKM